MSEQFKIYKIVVCGDSGVGKTCFIQRLVFNNFDSNTNSTVGASDCCLEKIIENKKIKFDIFDTPGQELYSSLNRIFYKDANFIIFVYDSTNRNSLQELSNSFYPQLRECFHKDASNEFFLL